MRNSICLGLALLSAGATAQADSNLPNLDGETRVGQSTVFVGPKPTLWHLAADFKAELECSPSGSSGGRSAHQSCVLSILNLPSNETRDAMAHLGALTGQAVASLSAMDSSIVLSVREDFQGEVTSLLPPGFKTPESLAMNSRGAYASLLFRVKSGEGDGFLKRFNQDGIGTFRSRIQLLGERVGDYVSLSKPQSAKAMLLASQGQILNRAWVNQLLERALEAGSLHTQGLDESEAKAIVVGKLRVELFSPVRGGFKLRTQALERWDVSGPLELVNQSSDPIVTDCTVELLLKNGATPQIQCVPEEL